MKIALKGYTAFFALMLKGLWNDTWIAEFSSMALPGSSAKIAAMNIYWLFLVSAVTFARPVIKRGWWNLGNALPKRN